MTRYERVRQGNVACGRQLSCYNGIRNFRLFTALVTALCEGLPRVYTFILTEKYAKQVENGYAYFLITFLIKN